LPYTTLTLQVKVEVESKFKRCAE